MSIFFKYLPYWADLAVRHFINEMHLQKNVFESTMGFLGLTGNVKDGLKSHKDLVDLKLGQNSTHNHVLMVSSTFHLLATT
jgi:hypothetical protein